MFENIINFFKKMGKKKEQDKESKDTAKERLHLVLMQDRANVSADFLDLMKQEIIEVIKKYIDVDENAIDVRLTNKTNTDGTSGAPALYANIPIMSIKNEVRHLDGSMELNKQQVSNELKEEKVPEMQETSNKKEETKQEAAKQEENETVQEEKIEEKQETVQEQKQEMEQKEPEINEQIEQENQKEDDNHEKKDS